MENLIPLPEDKKQHFAWLAHPALQKMMRGFEAQSAGCVRYVGGCVRDSLLGKGPRANLSGERTDIDVATILHPDETMRVLKNNGMAAHPTGYEHGTITGVCDNISVEITTLRADVSTDGRRATVAFSDNWDCDWRRRDFTINAIYATLNGQLYDPAGGVADLMAGRVRFIGHAERRLQEDYLRILRFYRFSARFAKEVDQIGRAACKTEAAGLQEISAERIGAEMLKTLALTRASEITTLMHEDGVLMEIFPVEADLKRFQFLQTLSNGLCPLNSIRALAALWPIETDSRLNSRFRLSNAQGARRVSALKTFREFKDLPNEQVARQLLYRFGAETFTDGVMLAWADALVVGNPKAKKTEQWQRLLSLPGRWDVPHFQVDGAMLQTHGIKAGPEMGKLLKIIEKAWIEAKFPEAKDDIITLIKEVIEAHKNTPSV